MAAALAVVALGLAATACGSSTEVGSGPGSTARTAPAPSTTDPSQLAGPSTTAGADPGGVASTIVSDPGGPGIPISTTSIAPSGGNGVILGTATGGLDCGPAEACPAIGIVVSGTVEAWPSPTNATSPSATATIDVTGTFGLAVPPGTYQVLVKPEGPDRCEPAEVTVTADQVAEVHLSCLRPA